MDRGLGAVCRDSHRNLLATGVRRVPASWATEVSELAAALFGVELALRMGYNQIHLEGDNAAVSKACTNASNGCSPFYVLLDRILSLIPYFGGFRSSVVRRSGNTTAHMVVRWNVSTVVTRFICTFPANSCIFSHY